MRHDHTLLTSEGAQKKSYSSSSDKWSQFLSISISICLICIIDYAMDYGDYHILSWIMDDYGAYHGAYADCFQLILASQCASDLPPISRMPHHRTSPHRGNHREVWPPIRCRGATVRFLRNESPFFAHEWHIDRGTKSAYSRWITLLDGLLDGLKVSCAWAKTQLFTRWKGHPFSESLGPWASFSHSPSCEPTRSQGNRKTEETHGDLLELRGWQGYLALMEDRSATTSTSSGFDLRSISISYIYIYTYISLSLYIYHIYIYISLSLYIYISLYIYVHIFIFLGMNGPQKTTTISVHWTLRAISIKNTTRVCHALEGWKAGETLRGGLCQFPWHLA